MTHTLTGSGFGDGATVTFRGVAATDVVVLDQTQITCTPPALADGFADIVVTNLDGVTGTLAGVFVYTTLSVTPTVGPITGGTTLTLTISDGGAGLSWFPAGHTFAVFVDNHLHDVGLDLTDPSLALNPAPGGQLPYTWVSSHQLMCVTAAQPSGPTDVVVCDLTIYPAPNVVFYLPLSYVYQLLPVTTWQLVGVLPECLSFSPLTGQICGTPMTVGTTVVTIIGTDVTGRTITFPYTLVVRPKP
jgi:hypothetical protein